MTSSFGGMLDVIVEVALHESGDLKQCFRRHNPITFMSSELMRPFKSEQTIIVQHSFSPPQAKQLAGGNTETRTSTSLDQCRIVLTENDT